jgi:hypothetical protein
MVAGSVLVVGAEVVSLTMGVLSGCAASEVAAGEYRSSELLVAVTRYNMRYPVDFKQIDTPKVVCYENRALCFPRRQKSSLPTMTKWCCERRCHQEHT